MEIILVILFFLVFALFLSMGLIPFTYLYYYIFQKQVKWYKPFFVAFSFTLGFIIVFSIGRMVSVEIERVLNYYMGILLYIFVFSLFFWFVHLILIPFKKSSTIRSKKAFYGICFLIISTSLFAVYQFEKPLAIEHISLESSKITQNYTFVHISDIQYGTVDVEYMNEVLDVAEDQNPDFIVFTGDLIDFDYYKREDFQRLADLDVPMYFERGNHEFYHFPDKLLSYLENISSVKLLLDESIVYEEIQLVGIDHNRSRQSFSDKLFPIKLSQDYYTILLYHEPRFVDVAVEKGFDLILYGHTHAGQIWPITKLIDVLYEYGDGLYEVGNSTIYTSDGAALWGPKMRLGSQNEIVVFTLTPS